MQTMTSNFIAMMHHLRTVSCQMKTKTDLTFGEFCVLSMISSMDGSNEKLTPTGLNDLLGTKKPATSRMLAVLEKKGYIIRHSDTKDHRISYLKLSQEGAKKLSEEGHAFEELIQRIATKMGKEEMNQMESLILKLTDILEEEENILFI